MEEILASIRRIIADDEAKPPVAEKPASPAAPAKPVPAAGAGSQAGGHDRYSAVGDCRGCEARTAACQTRAASGRAGTRARRIQQPGRHRRHAQRPR